MQATLKNIALLILIYLPSRTFASPQMPDYIIFKKDTIATYNLILEQYLRRLDTAGTQSLFGLTFRDGALLNCWRGYQAIYQIENESLFLVYIIQCSELGSGKINIEASAEKMKAIFGNVVIDGKVHIDWFSGDISFPLNNNVLRWDGVFYKIYEKETVVNVARGRVIHIKNVENYVEDPGAIDRKDRSKVSGTLFKRLKKVNWKKASDFDCSETYLVTIDQAGKVSKVAMFRYDTDEKIDEHWERDEYNYCIRTIFAALQPLKFDILKGKGRPISEDIYLEIWVNEKGKLENWTD